MKVVQARRKIAGEWRRVYIADYRDDNGKRPRPWFLKRYEAEREILKVKEFKLQAKLKPGGVVSGIDVWFGRYIEILENEGKSPKTITRYQRIIAPFLEWLKDNYRNLNFLDDVTADHLHDYLSYKRKTTSERTARVNTESTIYLTMKVIKQLFRKAHRMGKIPTNPLDAVKIKKPSQKRNKALTREEVGGIYRDGLGIIRDIAVFVLHTGLRQGEVCHLATSDIDLIENVLRIRGKGGKYRVVPIHKEAMAIIKKYYHKSKIYLFENPDNSNKIFRGGTLYQRLLKLYKLLGIEGANFHTLRHTFASEADYKGKDRLAVEMILGHRSEEYVTGRYLHANLDRMRQVVDNIDYTRS